MYLVKNGWKLFFFDDSVIVSDCRKKYTIKLPTDLFKRVFAKDLLANSQARSLEEYIKIFKKSE